MKANLKNILGLAALGLMLLANTSADLGRL